MSTPASASPPTRPSAWPRLMRAATAAAYVDERSQAAFRRAVGRLYPRPVRISGKGERWLREDLDSAIDALTGRTPSPDRQPQDAAGLV